MSKIFSARGALPAGSASALYRNFGAAIAVLAACCALSAQTGPTGFAPVSGVPIAAAQTPSGNTTYFLNEDESVISMTLSTLASVCPALGTNQFQAGNGDDQAIVYDPTANRLYILSIATDGNLGILYETPGATPGCNPSPLVELPKGVSHSKLMALDASEGNLYVISEYEQGSEQDLLWVLDVNSFASYSKSSPPPTYNLDEDATYGVPVIDPDSHYVFIPETANLAYPTGNGPGFFVFDPSQPAIVHVLGYVPSTGGQAPADGVTEVNFAPVSLALYEPGVLVMANNNPQPMSPLTDPLDILETSNIDFYDGNLMAAGFPTGLYLQSDAGFKETIQALATDLVMTAIPLMSVEDREQVRLFDVIYLGLIGSQSGFGYEEYGSLGGFDFQSGNWRDSVFSTKVPQPNEYPGYPEYSAWSQMDYVPESDSMMFLYTSGGAGSQMVSSSLRLSPPSYTIVSTLGTTSSSKYNPLLQVVNPNSSYVYNYSSCAGCSPPLPGTIAYWVPTAPGPAVTFVDGNSLDFGSQQVGSFTSKYVSLQNSGTANLTIKSWDVVNDATGSFLYVALPGTCGEGLALAPAATCTIELIFHPQKEGLLTADLVVNDNAGTSPQKVALSGTGTAPEPLLVPSEHVLDLFVSPGATATGEVTLTNTGQATARIIGSKTTGAGFSNSYDGPEDVPPGKGVTFIQYFAAHAAGYQEENSGESTYTYVEAPGSEARPAGYGEADGNRTPAASETYTLTINLIADVENGPIATPSPASLAFAQTWVGAASLPQTVTLTNTGNATMTISSLKVAGTNPHDFPIAKSCGTSLAAGKSCAITAKFAPKAAGALSASLEIAGNAVNAPQSVALTGTGFTAPAAAVRLSATSLSFGDESVGKTSVAKAVTVTNTSHNPLEIGAIAPGGIDASSFKSTNTCGTSLKAGASCTISVEFAPAAKGTLTATVTMTDNSTSSPQSIVLTGTGK